MGTLATIGVHLTNGNKGCYWARVYPRAGGHLNNNNNNNNNCRWVWHNARGYPRATPPLA